MNRLVPRIGWTPELRQVVGLAIEEFDAAYPGALPDDLKVVLYRDTGDGAAAFTWGGIPIANGAPANTLHINEYYFQNPYELVEPQIDWNEGTPSFVATELLADFAEAVNPITGRTYVGNLYDAAKNPEFQQGMMDRIVFHELAHIAEARLNQEHPDLDFNEVFPSYKSTWYPQRLPETHPAVPSPYSTDSPKEYFAEALTDAFFNREEAAPLSQWTALQLEDLLAGREPTERPSEATLSAMHRGEIDA
jgi:hypothetical protein